MSILLFLGLFAAYIALGTLALKKAFPNCHTPSVAVGLSICNVLAFLGVVLNGLYPPIPLGEGDLLPFLVIFYVALVLGNTVGLNHILDQQQLGYIGALIVSATLNLGLLILFGIPLFYAALSASNLLFKV